MAGSNHTGLGIKKKRSQQILTMAIESLEQKREFIPLRKLYCNVYDSWHNADLQVSWTRKEFSSLLSSHIRKPLDNFALIEKDHKVNKYGNREAHYRVKKDD
jgi:hypothetical protein